jgi:CheY-like chemotaxis protein
MNDTGTILLVDSNSDNLLILQSALLEVGFKQQIVLLMDVTSVLAYLNGEEAYRNRSAFPLPSLLVLDAQLRFNGTAEVLKWIQTKFQNEKSMVVLVLGTANDELEKQKLLNLGADAFLVQPFRYDDILEMVRGWHKYLYC